MPKANPYCVFFSRMCFSLLLFDFISECIYPLSYEYCPHRGVFLLTVFHIMEPVLITQYITALIFLTIQPVINMYQSETREEYLSELVSLLY